MRRTLLFLTLSLVLFIVACSPPAPAAETPMTPAPETAPEEPAEPPTIVSPTASSEAEQSPSATAELETPLVEPPVEEQQLSDEEIRQMLNTLSGSSTGNPFIVIDQVVASGDERFIPVFIELMRASQIGLVSEALYPPVIEALESLSGETFGADWPAWVEWYGATDLTPPPGFTTWKGLLLTPIDPGFAGFLRDDHPSRIRAEEIQWGGVRVDGIPALDNPAMLPAAEADYLEPGDAIFGLNINGEARAYPLRILDWHEMANDVIGGVPVSLAYCTLCGAAVAYDGRASNGNTYTFGSSGFLYRSNKLMYDRQTRTLWNQLTGEPVLGELAAGDVTLDILPVVLTTWEAWQSQHPETLVVDIDTGFERPYDAGAAYADYFASEGTMFPVWQRSDLLDTKEQIYAVRIEGTPKAYPLDLLTAEQVINDQIGETPLVLISGGAPVEVTGTSRRSGVESTYSAGGEVRAYERGTETFAPGEDPGTVRDAQGGVWQVTEEALVGPDGTTLARLPGHLAYWFGWFAFFPNTEVYGSS